LYLASGGSVRLNFYGSGNFTGTPTYNLSVDASGNIIETANSVDGSGTANYVSKWSDANTLTDSVIYDDGTNVGIGTTSPGYKLDVRSSLATIAMFGGTYAGIQGIQVQRNGGDNVRLTANYSGYGGGLESSDALRFSVNGADISNPSMYIETTGNVGIGTANPAYKLDVIGTAKLNISSGTNSNALFIREDTDNSITHNLWIDGSDNGNFWMYANGQDVKNSFKYCR
jgi:hypothetical protein